jgi:sucrose phosphorylase
VEQTGRYRTINREKLQLALLEEQLADPGSLRHQVFQQYVHLLRVRRSQRAFHPNGAQEVIAGNRSLFALLRTAPEPDTEERIICLHNVSQQEQAFEISLREMDVAHRGMVHDLVGGTDYAVAEDDHLRLVVAPYEVLWLKA